MPQYSVDNRTIDNVIGYIKDGQIAIPEIQRPFVWDSTKIRDLIDSLYRGFPVGYLIVWQNPNLKDKNGEVMIGKKIMIDGQQRVTAIMTAIVGIKVLDKDFKEKTHRIAFNPFAAEEEQCFEVQSAAIIKDKKWISDISVLFANDFNQYDFISDFCSKNPEMSPSVLSNRIQKVISIKNAPIGIIRLEPTLTIDDVTEIFIRINSKGKSLTQADFVMSTIAADEKNGGNILRKTIDYFCRLANNHDFINQIDKDAEFTSSPAYHLIKWVGTQHRHIYLPSFEDILRTAYMSNYYRAKLASLTDLLHGRNFETRTFEDAIMSDSFKNLTSGVNQVLDKYSLQQFNEAIMSAGFISKRLIKGRMPLNFAYTLFIRLRNDNSIDKLKVPHYVQKWYVMSVLTERYSSSPETKMDKDLRSIAERGFSRFYNETMENLGETFWNVTIPQSLQTSSSTSPVFYVYLAAQCKFNEDSFLGNGSKVRDLLESADIHHLFPRKYLQENGYDQVTQYNQVANYVVLNKSVNIAIGMKAPNVYLKEIYEACLEGKDSKYTMISDIEDYNENCRINCIPSDMKNMDYSHYETFLTERRKLMAQKIKTYFESL